MRRRRSPAAISPTRSSGLGGDDRLYGHGGNDALDGGAGDDTAVFSGAIADYHRAQYRRGRHQLHRHRPARRRAPTVSDTLTGIEHFKFSDVTVASAEFPANIDLSSLDGTNGFKLSGVAATTAAASRSPRPATSTATASPT